MTIIYTSNYEGDVEVILASEAPKLERGHCECCNQQLPYVDRFDQPGKDFGELVVRTHSGWVC